MDEKIILENELMRSLRELTDMEQNSFRILVTMYLNTCENIKNAKINSLEKALTNQIEFYGKNKDTYLKRINDVISKYSDLIDMIIKEYNIRLTTIGSELQDIWCNQKIAITNQKISIDQKNSLKQEAAMQKNNNYEIIAQECISDLEKCKIELENSINEIFFDKEKSLIVKKTGFLQKIINIFSGKNNIEKYVFNSMDAEMNKYKESIDIELKKINDKSVEELAIIKDAQMQTQNIFKRMLEG